jgi:hypothetical protein
MYIMNEAVRASSSTDGGSNEAAPVSATVLGASADRQDEAAVGTPEDEQNTFHQQMLYPTAGQRNYGFPDKFMIYTFKVCHLHHEVTCIKLCSCLIEQSGSVTPCFGHDTAAQQADSTACAAVSVTQSDSTRHMHFRRRTHTPARH